LPTDAHARFLGTRRFSALDGLRAVSVLAVIWHHTASTTNGFLSRGYLGVDMFFAISGFLITTLLLRERQLTGQISLKKFYLRRTLRIFPIYYLVLATYVVLVLLTRGHTPEAREFFHNLPAFATYTSNWFVDLEADRNVTFYFAWSLATEEQFYLLWPPVLVLLLTWRHGRIPLAVATLLLLVGLQVYSARANDGEGLGWRVLSSLAIPILLGAAMALTLHRPRGFQAVGPILLRKGTAPILTVTLLACTAMNVPTEVLQILMVALVSALCVREDTWIHPLLQLRPLVFVGGISYGMYLMHMLASNAVQPLIGSDHGVALFIVASLAVIVVAYLSFRFVEKPILAAKRRFEVVGTRPVDDSPTGSGNLGVDRS
jgi:peptidoglycan/LPS O-acetylase OafA/YrhL